MNKNRIEGRHGTSRGHNTPKTSGLPVEVNAAVVQGSIVQLPGEISPAQAAEKSAEAIVVGETSRGRDARINNDTGRLTQRRAEPNGSVLTARRTVKSTENARRRGGTESRRDGKHVGTQEQASACSSHGLVPCLNGTAVYGPVRTVVWDPGANHSRGPD